MLRFYAVLLLLCFFGMSLSAQQGWRDKVNAEVLDPAERGQSIGFMVVFGPQPDLSALPNIRAKERRATYVFGQLTGHALIVQEEAANILQQQLLPFRTLWIANALATEGDLELIGQLARLPEVAEILPDPEVRFSGPVGSSSAGGADSRAQTYGIGNIKADQVWALGYTGQNVVVGGQDTGYEWDHPAIKDRYRGWNAGTATASHDYNWHDAISTNGSGNSGTNPCGYDLTTPCDDNKHGTHTMGTMVGGADNAGTDIGVAPGASWIGCRNMERGVGTPSTYIECFQWFLAPTDTNDANPDPAKAPHVIANSWGCPPSEGCNTGNFSVMETAMNNLRSAGTVIVVSAGNSGSSCSTIEDPAAIFANSFTVGATSSTDQIASFSSRGAVTVDGSDRRKPDVSAPGVSVRSAVLNGQYQSLSGTSMAGPHVAGAVALIISANPALAGQVDQIETILENTARPRTSTQTCNGTAGTSIPNNTYGYGIIDAEAAVQEALALLPVRWASFTALGRGEDVLLQWATEYEENNEWFVVERSADGRIFESRGQLAAGNNSSERRDYEFIDTNPLPGISYYRIRQIDTDGVYTFSPVRSVRYAGEALISVSPNPVHETANLNFSDLIPSEFTAELIGADGRCYGTYRNTTQLELTGVPTGIYTLRISDGFGPYGSVRMVVE